MHCTDKHIQDSSIIWPAWLNGWVSLHEITVVGSIPVAVSK